MTLGTVDSADPAIVALVAAPISCGDPLRVLCSGTLISPNVVLTAAHCTAALPTADVLVYFGTDVADGMGVLVTVDHVIAHPDYASPNNDVALIVLAESVPTAPARLRSAPLAQTDVGTTTRVVGFGLDEMGGLGVKRTGTTSITQVDARDFVIGPAPAMSCDGDSGGAVFVTAGSVEEVAGITSFGDARCMESGTNTRVDAYRTDFIDPDTAAAGATPPTRPAFDPGTDYCMDACTSDADCPVGMGCTPNPAGGTSCGFRGLPPGRFGAACVAGGSCESGMCLAEGAGCLCYTPCTAPPGDDGGCGCTTSPGSATPVWTLVIACGLFVKRRRARAITRSAQGPPSCRTRRASWRHDRHPHGGDDNIFPHPECELVQSCCADDITTPAPDRIRSGLRERGIELLDIADGVRWKRS